MYDKVPVANLRPHSDPNPNCRIRDCADCTRNDDEEETMRSLEQIIKDNGGDNTPLLDTHNLTGRARSPIPQGTIARAVLSGANDDLTVRQLREKLAKEYLRARRPT